MKKMSYGDIKTFIEVESLSKCKLLTIDTIKNTRQLLTIQCKCGTIFNTSFLYFKHEYKRQCNSCGKENRKKKERLEYEQVKQYIEKHKCQLLSTHYENNSTLLKIKCKCNNVFQVNFNNFKNNNQVQCKACGYKTTSQKSKKEFKEILDFVSNNSQCTLLSVEYEGNKYKLLFECLCGNKFTTSFNRFKNKNQRQCKKCSTVLFIDKVTKTHSEFINDLKLKYNNEYICLDEYVGTRTKLHFKHNKCNSIFYCSPNNILSTNSCSCPNCGITTKKTHEDFCQIVAKLTDREYICLTEYKNSKTKIKLKHDIDKCGHEFFMMPNNFMNQGQRCPKCKSSKGEKIIYDLLKQYNINFKTQYKIKECKNKLPLPFDFAIIYDNQLQCLIEYDGWQHFNLMSENYDSVEKLEQRKTRDSIKDVYCKENNILLIRIPYWEISKLTQIITELLTKLQLLEGGLVLC